MYNTLRILLIVLSFTSCNKYKVLNETEINQTFVVNSSASFKGYYYMGSDKNYHYFESRWKWAQDRKFKIPIESLVIDEKYRFKPDTKELRIDVFNYKDADKPFGKNQFYTLYIVEAYK